MAKEKKKSEAPEEEKKTENAETVKETDASAEKAEEKTPSKEEQLQKELDDKNDQLLRMAAEYDNFRKRSQREKDALYAECKNTVISELLPVIDNFDRVFANPDASAEDYKKGVEMTYKQFNDIIKKLGVESFGEVGDAFDPNIHNAVMHTEDENQPENTVTVVMQKGYKLGEKIIRHAMVGVAN
ncbi:MAG: nucleotide exchange factor GrpE [Clostridia bacterium]|nr:nucleotide exchange factor GrpE [Clostridia bacterium]